MQLTVYEIDGITPVVDPTAFVHPSAVLIGDVLVGPGAYVGPCASLRGDFGRLVPSSPRRTDERDDQTRRAAHGDVHDGPAQRDELVQVRNARHRGDQEVGERAQEAEQRRERPCRSGHRCEQRDSSHRQGRPHCVTSGGEGDDVEDESESRSDERDTSRDSRRSAGGRGSDDGARQCSDERSPHMRQCRTDSNSREQAGRQIAHEPPRGRCSGGSEQTHQSS